MIIANSVEDGVRSFLTGGCVALDGAGSEACASECTRLDSSCIEGREEVRKAGESLQGLI